MTLNLLTLNLLTLAKYRVFLFGQGEENEGTDAQGRPVRRGLSKEQVATVVAGKGRVGLSEYVRMRVRYFADGAVLGTRGFVDGVFRSLRNRFGPKRKDGARRMRGVESEELYALRDLRLRVVEESAVVETDATSAASA